MNVKRRDARCFVGILCSACIGVLTVSAQETDSPSTSSDRTFRRTAETLFTTARSLGLRTITDAYPIRDGILAEWNEQYETLQAQIGGSETLPPGAREQVLDAQALIRETDRDPLDVVLRRTSVLLEELSEPAPLVDESTLRHDLEALLDASGKTPLDATVADGSSQRNRYYVAACALRRLIAFSNPLVDFDRILFVARGVYLGSRKNPTFPTNDKAGQHQTTQYFAFNSIPGGGLYTIENFKSNPRIVDVLSDSTVANGRLKGSKPTYGAFLSPDLSYDGQSVLFAWTENREHTWRWSEETVWHIFKVAIDGSNLTQLTDGICNDFDPCWLPNGEIAFISERRGGFIRCFTKEAGLRVPTYVLHSMKADGRDITPISYFETSEWHPSVNNDGMLVFSRWDYVDREDCLGSNFWIAYPDGRDPRAPHGNYPYPWHTFEDNDRKDSRFGRPYTELNMRSIPQSHRYILTAAPHHGEAFGSLVLLDTRIPDDGHMSQVKRITPYAKFPEAELLARGVYQYGTAWPLSEDYYLCNSWENLYLLDRFGNQVLICEAERLPCPQDERLRLIDPIPLRARPAPPVLPTLAQRGDTPSDSDERATIGIMNVYDSDLPFPRGTVIKWLRVLQVIPKPNPWMDMPMIGYAEENTPRIPLGIVPVEADGSAYFEAPPGKELLFQALDKNRMAVQSMRSAAFVHPGESLNCLGCHEHKHKAPTHMPPRLAQQRPPSKLEPEVGPVEPITYYRLVQPVFEKTCVPCHREQDKGPQDMSYEKLREYAFHFSGGFRGNVMRPNHGGSRTIPGRFGARYSRMGKALLSETHRGMISEEEFRRVVLWLDANSLRLGAFVDEDKQMRGELVWPLMDVDPNALIGAGTTARAIH